MSWRDMCRIDTRVNCVLVIYINSTTIMTRVLHVLEGRIKGMPNGNKPTENEHFIPRMYLKGFSEIKNKSKKKSIYLGI